LVGHLSNKRAIIHPIVNTIYILYVIYIPVKESNKGPIIAPIPNPNPKN